MPRVHRPSRRAPRPSSPEKTRPDTPLDSGTLAALASNVLFSMTGYRAKNASHRSHEFSPDWLLTGRLTTSGQDEGWRSACQLVRSPRAGCCCCWIACVSAPPPSAHHDAKATNARPVPRRLTPRVPFSRTAPHAPPPRRGFAPRRPPPPVGRLIPAPEKASPRAAKRTCRSSTRRGRLAPP